MRIAILWTSLSGYLNACLRQLAERQGIELFVAYRSPGSKAPFHDGLFEWIPNRWLWHSRHDLGGLQAAITGFMPDLLLIAGWHVPTYRQIARAFSTKAWRIMAMDNCWNGTLRQRGAIAIAPFFLHPLADAVWVPGERQVLFARLLGFAPHQILCGLYSGNTEAFAYNHLDRILGMRPVPRAFLFVGRMAAEKGIEVLRRAYLLYRGQTEEPWPLICCGVGPLAFRLGTIPGVLLSGFVQPERLPSLMAEAGCLVIPSHFEPWGVAVHEAAAAGLIILASENVGASWELVHPGETGFIFRDGDATALAARMQHLSNLSERRLSEMSHASHLLARQFSPSRWVDTLLEHDRRCSDKLQHPASLQEESTAGTEFESFASK